MMSEMKETTKLPNSEQVLSKRRDRDGARQSYCARWACRACGCTYDRAHGPAPRVDLSPR
eukprot:6200336-Pleurochrysis_carterae.AAC.3